METEMDISEYGYWPQIKGLSYQKGVYYRYKLAEKDLVLTYHTLRRDQQTLLRLSMCDGNALPDRECLHQIDRLIRESIIMASVMGSDTTAIHMVINGMLDADVIEFAAALMGVPREYDEEDGEWESLESLWARVQDVEAEYDFR